jgi:hypothetical protein
VHIFAVLKSLFTVISRNIIQCAGRVHFLSIRFDSAKYFYANHEQNFLLELHVPGTVVGFFEMIWIMCFCKVKLSKSKIYTDFLA